MRGNYVSLSLETHLFFGRIMKEHSLFLLAGFPAKNEDYIRKADWFRREFEEFLCEVVEISQNRIGRSVLESGEIVTEFTLGAERRTSFLTGIEIDSEITMAEKNLRTGRDCGRERIAIRRIRNLNQRALRLVNGLIAFKENILRNMMECRLLTFNYQLLIEHILREARLYRGMLMELERTGNISNRDMLWMERFWNQIMMEHALFIRGLLDPTEEELIMTADGFAEDYKELLEQAREKDCEVTKDLTERTLQITEKYRDFKAAGTKGITECEIAGLILPLLADHVLREANHYLRLLETECEE